MKWRKKPVVIDAWQWPNGEGVHSAITMAGGQIVGAANNCFAIQTLEGTMLVQPGDWIIRGVKGEYYPCKPDIFEATYEPA
jgi:hypothetical protein